VRQILSGVVEYAIHKQDIDGSVEMDVDMVMQALN
jgi:hypothetical protein